MEEYVAKHDLTNTIDQINSAIAKIKDRSVIDQLSILRTGLETMKVAEIELEHLTNEFHRGNLTTEVYLDRHKKLLFDYISARNGISGSIVPKIVEAEESVEARTRLSRFASALAENKDFAFNLAQLVLTIIASHGIH